MDYAKSKTKLRTLLSIVFVWMILFQSSVRTVIAVSFYLNKQFIAVNLCENRLDRNSDCKGRCYLKKQLHAENEKEQSLPEIFKERVEWVARIESMIIDFFVTTNRHEPVPFYLSHYALLLPVQFFHPPCRIELRCKAPRPLFYILK